MTEAEVQAQVDNLKAIFPSWVSRAQEALDDPEQGLYAFYYTARVVEPVANTSYVFITKDALQLLIKKTSGPFKVVSDPSWDVTEDFGDIHGGSRSVMGLRAVADPFHADVTYVSNSTGGLFSRLPSGTSLSSQTSSVKLHVDHQLCGSSPIYKDLYGFSPSWSRALVTKPRGSSTMSALSSVIGLLGSLEGHRRFVVQMTRPIFDPSERPGLIGYYASFRDIGKKVTWTRPGRYLTRAVGEAFFGGQTGLQEAALSLSNFVAPQTLKVAETPEECEEVYKGGPSSCMSGTKAMRGDQHPACVYGGEATLTVAYIGPKGKASARAVVCPSKKTYTTIYGDIERLEFALKAAGFTEEDNDFVGERLNSVLCESDPSMVMLPYLDFDAEVGYSEDFLRIRRAAARSLDTSCTGGAVGIGGRYTCDDCEESCDDTTETYDGSHVCGICLSDSYVYVRSVYSHVSADEVIYAHDIQECVLSYADEVFVCERTEETCAGERVEVIVGPDGETQIWARPARNNHAEVAIDGALVSDDYLEEYERSLQEAFDATQSKTPRCPETPDMFSDVYLLIPTEMAIQVAA